MPLEAIGPMMRRAARGGYAVGYFESWNLESLQGVVDAAEQTRFTDHPGFQRCVFVRSAGCSPNGRALRGPWPSGRGVVVCPVRA